MARQKKIKKRKNKNTKKVIKKNLKNSVLPFHLAIPVADVQIARQFYGGVLGL